jgi:histidine triad (HIT) family protein
MTDSIFTKIIKGEIPAEKIYEDDQTIAFLDIHPLVPGHTLVVPKIQVDKFNDLPEKDYRALWQTVKKVADRIQHELDPTRVCIRVEGFDVPHTHVHVYPCNVAEDFYGDEDRLAKEPDHEALAEMAKKLAF